MISWTILTDSMYNQLYIFVPIFLLDSFLQMKDLKLSFSYNTYTYTQFYRQKKKKKDSQQANI